MYLAIGLIFIIGSSLLLHMVLFAEAFMWVPRHTKDTLFVSAVIGYICAIEALVLTALQRCPSQYHQVPEDPSDFCIQERELSPLSSTDIANHTHTSSEMPNHTSQHNRISPNCNQKPYIPGELLAYLYFLRF